MKRIDLWLNEEQYKEWNKQAEKLHLSRTALLKRLAVLYLESDTFASLARQLGMVERAIAEERT